MNIEESKYHYGREIIFNLKSCQAITPEVYLHWLNKIDSEEAIAVAQSSTQLKEKEKITFDDWLIKHSFKRIGNSYVYKKGNSNYDREQLRKLHKMNN